MNESKRTVCGLTFEAVRFKRPIPHWRLRLPCGKVWEPGTAGIKGDSRRAMWDSLEYLASRIGSERFVSGIEAESAA